MSNMMQFLKYRVFIPRDKLMEFAGKELVNKFPELDGLEVSLRIEFDEEGFFCYLDPKSKLLLGPQEQGKQPPSLN